MASLKRWSAKSGKISLSIEPTRARGISSATVVVAIPLKTNAFVMDAINCCSYPLSTKYLDESVLAYAVYKAACKKLSGADKTGIASGATNVTYGCHPDEFQICVTVGPKISAVRKAAGIVVSCLKFGSLSGKYSIYCKRMEGIKPDKSAFEAAATAANAAVNSGITIVATGRLNVARKELVEHAADVIVKKLKVAQSAGKGSSRTVETKEKPEDYFVALDVSDLSAVVVKGYVDQVIPEYTKLHGGKLWVPKSSMTKAENAASTDRIKQYVRGLDSLKDELTGALVNTAAMHGYVSTRYLDVGKSVSTSNLASAISKALK